MCDVIGKLLQDNNMPDTPTARAIYRKMLEPDDTQFYTNEARTWQGLEAEDLAQIESDEFWQVGNHMAIATAVEAALKKKNT